VPSSGSGGGVDSQVIAQDANDASIVNTLGSSTSAAGIYTASGSLQNLSSETTANLSSILSNSPSLSGEFVGDSFASGIVGTLSVSA
jgi:hypothetical protein